jgi:hypothetical protein
MQVLLLFSVFPNTNKKESLARIKTATELIIAPTNSFA